MPGGGKEERVLSSDIDIVVHVVSEGSAKNPTQAKRGLAWGTRRYPVPGGGKGERVLSFDIDIVVLTRSLKAVRRAPLKPKEGLHGAPGATRVGWWKGRASPVF